MTTIDRARTHASLRPIATGIAGLAALILSAQVQVPMYPVPMTMQTFVVLLLALIGGARVAVGTSAAYLALGVAGAPVFAGFAAAGGAAILLRPSAGYVVGWVAGGAIAARLRGSFARSLAAGVALHVVTYTVGVAWLSRFVGVERAMAVGVLPFLLGDAVKCVLAALVAGRVAR